MLRGKTATTHTKYLKRVKGLWEQITRDVEPKYTVKVIDLVWGRHLSISIRCLYTIVMKTEQSSSLTCTEDFRAGLYFNNSFAVGRETNICHHPGLRYAHRIRPKDLPNPNKNVALL